MEEAHTADPAGLGVFLNAFQDSARMAPMRLVLACTPDVRDVLSASGATFADRMDQLPIGLLPPEAGRAAIAEPFAGRDIDAVDGVVECLAAWADNYPYFLQVVGSAAWTEAATFDRLTSETGEAAIDRVRVLRNRYYATRYKELAASGQLEFAVAVARAGREEPVYRGLFSNRRKSLRRLIRKLSPDGAAISFAMKRVRADMACFARSWRPDMTARSWRRAGFPGPPGSG